MGLPNVIGHHPEALKRTKGKKQRQVEFIICPTELELGSPVIRDPGSQASRFRLEPTLQALCLPDLLTTPPGVLGLQLADYRSWNFSASIIVEANISYHKYYYVSIYTLCVLWYYLYIFIFLFLWRTLTNANNLIISIVYFKILFFLSISPFRITYMISITERQPEDLTCPEK